MDRSPSNPHSAASRHARRPLRAVLVAALCISTIACGGGSAGTTTSSGGSNTQPVGAAVPSSLFSLTVHSRNNWPSATFSGVRLWNTGTYWLQLNPAQGVYDWTALDNYLNTAQAQNVDVIYTFGETPAWASSSPTQVCGTSGQTPGSCAPPNDLNSDGTGTNQHWKDFVSAIVTHAAGRIQYWEIWNEPTVPGYWVGTTAQMLRMAQDAYTIIKAADPSALVTTPTPSTGINGVASWMGPYLAMGGGQYADIISFHGYSWSSQPGVYPKPEDIVPLVENLRTQLLAYGQNQKPLWCTEGSWGDTSGNGFVDQDMHAAYLARHYLLQQSEGVLRYYWFAWDNGNDTAGLPDGLWSATIGLTPAGLAYEQVENWIVGAVPSAQCSANGTVWTCSYARDNGYQAEATWDTSQSCSNGTCNTQLQSVGPQFVHYRDLNGNTIPISNGSAPVGAKPIFLENQ